MEFLKSYGWIGALAVSAITFLFNFSADKQRITDDISKSAEIRAILVDKNEKDHAEFRDAIKQLAKIATDNREMISTNQQDIARLKGILGINGGKH